MTITNAPSATDQRAREEIAYYLQDLARLPVLSREEEQQLIQHLAQATTADPAQLKAARQRLLEGHLAQVVQVAKHHLQPELELADLVQEGNLALLQAARSFDPQRHPPFRSFARRFVCWHLSHVVNAALQSLGHPTQHHHGCLWCHPGEGQVDDAWCRKELVQEIERT